MANLVYKRVSTDQQSTARQNLVLDEAGIEDPVVFEEEAGTSSRLHPFQRPKFGELLRYRRPGDIVHISALSVPRTYSRAGARKPRPVAARVVRTKGTHQPASPPYLSLFFGGNREDKDLVRPLVPLKSPDSGCNGQRKENGQARVRPPVRLLAAPGRPLPGSERPRGQQTTAPDGCGAVRSGRG
ncbi:recombinase family protein [Streptomyces violascens]|uniref:recombinase family protein n=1 Tax=Streptomyces violascens TaxID=67381 RepID=UPI0037B5D6B2